MTRSANELCRFLLLSLIAVSLTGCATKQEIAVCPSLSPIYISKDDKLTTGTKQQILQLDCKLDYNKKACDPASSKQKGN